MLHCSHYVRNKEIFLLIEKFVNLYFKVSLIFMLMNCYKNMVLYKKVAFRIKSATLLQINFIIYTCNYILNNQFYPYEKQIIAIFFNYSLYLHFN